MKIDEQQRRSSSSCQNGPLTPLLQSVSFPVKGQSDKESRRLFRLQRPSKMSFQRVKSRPYKSALGAYLRGFSAVFMLQVGTGTSSSFKTKMCFFIDLFGFHGES